MQNQSVILNTNQTHTHKHQKRTEYIKQQKNSTDIHYNKSENSENKQELDGTNGKIGKAINKKKQSRTNEQDEYLYDIQNLIQFSLKLLSEEYDFQESQQNKKVSYREYHNNKMHEQNEIEAFFLPPSSQQISQQKQKTSKKNKNKKCKGEFQNKVQKSQTLTQKQQPQQPQLSPQKQLSSLSIHDTKQINKKKQSINFQIEHIEQLDKKDSIDLDIHNNHIAAKSTTTGNSQSESDDGLLQHEDNKQQQHITKVQKEKNNKRKSFVTNQFPHSTQTTPIKKKQLNLNKSRTYDIDEFTRVIQQRSFSNKINKRICFNRLHYIISLQFNLNIYPYGSFETGLDLEDSDVDVGIWGSQNLCYSQIVQILSQIATILKQSPFLINYKLIQSNMPILKLELNPNSPFYVEDPYIQQNWNSFNIEQNQLGKIIYVDISWVYQWSNMYNNPHLGFASTSLVKDWLIRFSWYGEILLILKHLVKSKNLNDSYSGGISSFCLSIMLAAIYMIKTYNHHDKKQVLLDFLKKYGSQFNPQIEGIFIDNYGLQNPFIQLDQSTSHPPLTIYSPINEQIISQKATKFFEIQEEFKKLYDHLTKSNKIQDYFDQVNQQLFI